MRGQVISYRSCCREVGGRSPLPRVLLVSAAAAPDALLGVTLPGLSPQVALVAAVLAAFAFIAEGRL